MANRKMPVRVAYCLGLLLALLAVVTFLCRTYGVPASLLRSDTYSMEDPVYRLVGQVFGYCAIGRTSDGRVRWRVHERFPSDVLSRRQRGFDSIIEYPIVDADYYDARGERISTIRDGNGVAVTLSDSDRSCMIVSYVGGIRCGLCVSTYGSGKVRFLRYYDNDGLPHGPIMGYYENGARRFEGAFDHGVPQGTWRGCSEDGQEDPHPEDHPGVKAFRHQ